MVKSSFSALTVEDKRDALSFASDRNARPTWQIEKDVWVVETLSVLVESTFGSHLTFKGGTSLAKVWRAIHRFSEDVDITYDIREFAPDLVKDSIDEAFPPTPSQERRWSKKIRHRLAEWIWEEAKPVVEAGLERDGFSAIIEVADEKLCISYEPIFDDYGFASPFVIVEFGARSTGEPRDMHIVECDAAAFLPDVCFPTAHPFVMRAERTFWEKTMAAHAFCLRQRARGQRQSRHWHDIVRLDDFGTAERAIAERDLAQTVAHHQAVFFKIKDANGNWIDFESAVSGGLHLVPDGPAFEALRSDYDQMRSDGILLGDDTSFCEVMERCSDIETKINHACSDNNKVG